MKPGQGRSFKHNLAARIAEATAEEAWIIAEIAPRHLGAAFCRL
jgi:hypothetical protein